MDFKTWYLNTQGIATELGGLAILVSFSLWLRKRLRKFKVVLISKASTGYSQAFVDSFTLELKNCCPYAELSVAFAKDEDGNSFRAEFSKAIECRPSAIVIIVPHKKDGLAQLARKAMRAHIPVVCIDQGFEEIDCFCEDGLLPPAVISCDNEKGGTLAALEFTRCLAPMANVALVTGPLDSNTSNARKTAFIQTALAHGLVVCWEMETQHWDVRGKEDAIAQKKATCPVIDGIFCCNDRLAMQMLAITRRIWSNAPPKIIGFDGISEAEIMVKDGALLATIDQNVAAQAMLAVTELMIIINRGRTKYIKKHKVNNLIEPILMNGES